jgi:hypothetical protein
MIDKPLLPDDEELEKKWGKQLAKNRGADPNLLDVIEQARVNPGEKYFLIVYDEDGHEFKGDIDPDKTRYRCFHLRYTGEKPAVSGIKTEVIRAWTYQPETLKGRTDKGW